MDLLYFIYIRYNKSDMFKFPSISKILKMSKKNPMMCLALLVAAYFLLKKVQEGFYSSEIVKTGLVGHYTGDSLSGKTWKDISGNGNNATVNKGKVSNMDWNGKKTVKGDVNSGIIFPKSILPSNYTLCYLSRYAGNTKGRIIQGLGNNWLTGHWNTKSGVAYHEGWLTSHKIDNHGSNWVLGTDQNTLYRSNNVERGKGKSNGKNTQLAVNISGQYAEKSDWEIAEIIVYNRHLNASEIKDVEGYLAHKYNHLKDKYPAQKVEVKKVEAKPEAKPEPEPEPEPEAEEAKPTASASGICFPETAIVNGKPITELKIGDMVPTSKGMSKVTTFLHYEPEIKVNMIRFILDNDNKTTVSRDHMIFSNNKYKSAVSVNVGDYVDYKGEKVKIVEKFVVPTRGLYAPLTDTGNIIVDNIHYSCYTQTAWTRNVSKYQEFINSLVQPTIKYLEKESKVPMYLYARMLEKYLI